ncbi:hypothetical protein LCGC14_2775370 [marine sediment metagenome]|uniref:Uncharacterized protein n=1 Tax=marine sediment metagenome TaxID=412755 RepID=A0A0F9B3M0_9ZZZZ
MMIPRFKVVHASDADMLERKLNDADPGGYYAVRSMTSVPRFEGTGQFLSQIDTVTMVLLERKPGIEGE